MRKRILLVEDDEEIRSMIKDYLSGEFEVCFFSDGKTAMRKLANLDEYSLALIDLMLPDISGMELIKAIRQVSTIPVIIITAKDNDTDKSLGLNLGADDYVVKPFELEVLYSRIQALRRRIGNAADQYLSCAGIIIDQNRHTVSCHSEEISLSAAEYQLLLYLMQNKGRTITREKLLEQVWDVNGNYVNNNTLTVTMKRLRDKLYQPRCIKTVRSVGYRMEDDI